ncbi:hypothetical protein ACFFJI_04465 [Allobacillus sp. GCM10007491]|uniref:DUF3139 domain-containing protein n=1 Tax=Allobacillus saliphilus TaxID=2912308 RepID=A0A941HTF3_9BACI|nr:hypothetical protein [Allobacillus saliphilus]MBR7554771.1 hypothetical protein [Allobacillus saliphilus]
MRKYLHKVSWRHAALTLFYTALLLLVVSPFFYIYYVNNGMPIFDERLEAATIDHLKSVGLSEDEIADSKVVRPNYETDENYYKAHVFVSFVDDPDTYYIYGREKYFGDIVQYCEKEVIFPKGHQLVREAMSYNERGCISLPTENNEE